MAERLLLSPTAAPVAMPWSGWPVAAIVLSLWAHATIRFRNSRMNSFDGLRRREARLALVIASQPTARVAISRTAERGGENDQQTCPAGHGRSDRTRLRRRRFRT